MRVHCKETVLSCGEKEWYAHDDWLNAACRSNLSDALQQLQAAPTKELQKFSLEHREQLVSLKTRPKVFFGALGATGVIENQAKCSLGHWEKLVPLNRPSVLWGIGSNWCH